MTYILRDYQEQAVDKIEWASQLEGNDLIVLPTGAGKSLVIAEAANRLKEDILILQPSREILAQNLAKLRTIVNQFDIGVYSASFNSRKVRKYTFATIQSVYEKPYLFKHFKYVMVDECHGVNQKNEDSMYATFFKEIGDPKVFGFTASPYRGAKGFGGTCLKLINRMKPFFWQRIIFNINPGDLVNEGYLVPLVYDDRSVVKHEDLRFNKSHSDFDMKNYENQVKINYPAVIEDIKDNFDIFTSNLVFCSSVEQAYLLSDMVPGSKAVCGKTKPGERDEIIEGFKSGRIHTVFNMGVLTTGFDHPALDCITLLRPTKSLSLYYQMLGRGVRTFPNKTHCTVIDYTNTVAKIGEIETIRLVKEQQAQYKNPVWELYCGNKRWHGKTLYTYMPNEHSKPKAKPATPSFRWY